MSCIIHPAISLSFTDGQAAYLVSFDRFTSEPRQYVTAGELQFSISGAAVQTGSSRANRMTWSIAAFADEEQRINLDAMYRAWDAHRAAGFASVVGVTDQTRVPDPINAPIIKSAVFTAPPTFDPRPGPVQLLSFGLTEI